MTSTKMTYELTKTESPLFSEYYTGYNPQTSRTVHCILADNCVRYVVFDCMENRILSKREFGNQDKARCLARATAALNE